MFDRAVSFKLPTLDELIVERRIIKFHIPCSVISIFLKTFTYFIKYLILKVLILFIYIRKYRISQFILYDNNSCSDKQINNSRWNTYEY